MKKLITLLLVLTGAVCSANAQITETGYKKVYVHDNTSLNWSQYKLHYWNTGVDDDTEGNIDCTSTETIDGTIWKVFKVPTTYATDMSFLIYNGSWNGSNQTEDFTKIWGDSFFEMTHDGNTGNKAVLAKLIRYYMIKDTEPNSPTKLDKNGDVWEITVQEDEGFKFSIINNYAYQSGTFSWEQGFNIYRPRGDSQHVTLNFENISNYGFSKNTSDGNWIIGTDNSVKHYLTFTFTNDGWNAGVFTDSPSFTRTLPAAAEGFATFSSDYDVIPDATLTAVQYASAVDASTGAITWANYPATGIKAGQGALLTGTAGQEYKFTPATEAVAPDANSLKAITSAYANAALPQTVGGYTNFILSKPSEHVGFYKVAEGGSWVNVGNAYLQVSGTSLARQFFPLWDEDVTAVEAVKQEQKVNGEFFNLAGQRVAQPTKGLYIVNGKKVVLK